jgi:hypothetical protein
MYYISRSHLLVEVSSDAAAYPTVLNPTSSTGELRRCHVSYCFLWIVDLKYKEKSSCLAYAARLDVSKAHTHIFKTTDLSAIMSLQDVLTDSVFNICKTCGQVTTAQLQCIIDIVNNLQGTALVTDDPIITMQYQHC